MGDPKKSKKHYTKPKKRWDKTRIENEKKLTQAYGLKNKREIRRLETVLRGKRQQARKMLAQPEEKREKFEKQLMGSLDRMSLLGKGGTLDDVLSLSLPGLMERRLQTIVWKKNLAKTVKQARQFITHGHIGISGKKVSCPGYLVRRDEEDGIAYFKKPMQIEPPKAAKKPAAEGAQKKAAAGEAGPEAAEALGENAKGKEAGEGPLEKGEAL